MDLQTKVSLIIAASCMLTITIAFIGARMYGQQK